MRVVLFGHPVAHSLSPAMQNAAFAGLGRPERYEAVDVPPERLAAYVQMLRDGAYLGANVTVPHKLAVAEMMDDLDAEALASGAVNAITVEDGRLRGHNTDVHGAWEGLLGPVRDSIKGSHVLILGAGGGARAVLLAMARHPEHLPEEVVVNGRTTDAREATVAIGRHAGVNCRGARWGTLGREAPRRGPTGRLPARRQGGARPRLPPRRHGALPARLARGGGGAAGRRDAAPPGGAGVHAVDRGDGAAGGDAPCPEAGAGRMTALLCVAAAALGVAVGWGTHLANQALARAEPEATEPPLPRELLWAPVLDALLFGLLCYRFGLTLTTLVDVLIAAVLVQVLVFDARHRLILNRIIYPSIAAAFLIAPVSPLLRGAVIERLESAALGALVAGGIFFILVVASRGGIGLGDAKLTFFMGAIFGLLPFPDLPVLRALLYGVVLGGIAGVVLLVTRIRGMRDFIPYGPFLCCGGLLVLFYPCTLFGPASCG
jgi:prepilin signal peptidase PulO-like enzyme (type II secretory pathway)